MRRSRFFRVHAAQEMTATVNAPTRTWRQPFDMNEARCLGGLLDLGDVCDLIAGLRTEGRPRSVAPTYLKRLRLLASIITLLGMGQAARTHPPAPPNAWGAADRARQAERSGNIGCCCARRREILVGVAGFEPATPSSRTTCATRLRYTP